MARSLWLRLFGPNGPTSIAEFREALATAPFGDNLGDTRSIEQILGLVDRPSRGSPDEGRADPVHVAGPSAEAVAAGTGERTANYILLSGDGAEAFSVVDGNARRWSASEPGQSYRPALPADTDAPLDFSHRPLGAGMLVTRTGDWLNLSATDHQVAAGETLTVDVRLRAGATYIAFDGSAETDGSYIFKGGGDGDVFLGGAGDDLVYGMGGGDRLGGGGGSDVFAYADAADSTGADHDVLTDFNAADDLIALPVAVTGFGDAVESGALSTASFDDDLSAALAGLGTAQAAWFAPDSGDLAGKIFLVVDANGVEGYQAGEDYVFGVEGASLADLAAHTDIFV